MHGFSSLCECIEGFRCRKGPQSKKGGSGGMAPFSQPPIGELLPRKKSVVAEFSKGPHHEKAWQTRRVTMRPCGESVIEGNAPVLPAPTWAFDPFFLTGRCSDLVSCLLAWWCLESPPTWRPNPPGNGFRRRQIPTPRVNYSASHSFVNLFCYETNLAALRRSSNCDAAVLPISGGS